MSRFPVRRRSVLRPTAALGALALAAVGLTTLPASASVNADVVTLDVLAFNDFHGRLEANGDVAGAAVLAGAADALRGANPGDSVLVSAGDNIGASTFTSMVQKDEPTIDALNTMGLFASAVGNHEFDAGAADLTGRVSTAATFPYLAANVEGSLPNIDDYAIFTSASGVTIGFVGVVTPLVPSLVAPAGVAGLTFTPMVDAANRVAADLSDGNATNGEADIVVVLAHDGAGSDTLASATDAATDFGTLVNGASANIDAIVSGHTHALYSHTVDGMTVTQAGQYSEYLTQLTFTYNTTTEAVSATATNIDLVTQTGTGDDEVDVPAYPANTAVTAIVDAAVAQAAIEGGKKLGDITADFNRAKQSDGAENRGGESTLGNLVADIQLAATKELGTTLAIMNPGGLRKDLTYAATAGEPDNGAGVVTFKEAAEVQPFANTLVTLDLTGAQLKQVLEEQWQPATSSRPFLKLGLSKGLEYTYDPEAAKGSHITGITLDGKAVDPAASYKIVTNSFLASGGDNFVTLGKGANVADSGRTDLQAFADYLAANSPVAPDNAQRAVGVNVDGTLTAGSRVTLNLSSLSFSTNEAKPTTVTVKAGSTVLGTANVNPAIVDTTDEVGRASVTVTIPAGATTLSISTTTGTDVTFPLTGATAGGGDDVGFFLNDAWSGTANHEFMYGRFTDEVLIGDWDGDGTDSITVRRGNQFYINNAPRGGQAEKVISYGKPGDVILVGDWDGDGVDTLAVRRGNVYHVKNSLSSGAADQVVGYGKPGDQVIVGNFDGKGGDSFTVRRASTYYVKNTIAGGSADQVIAYGKATDVTLAGDWDGDGTDTFAARRGNAYYVKNTIAGGSADFVLAYGRATDEVYVGDWNGDGTDTLGVRRHP